MDQRRLKVGDVVDDYCPRERRVTDHAIVAMIDQTIRQTRCTACDNEHPYKEARVPRARRKSAPAALYQEVLASVTDPQTPASPKPGSQESPMSEDATPAEPVKPAAEEPVLEVAGEPVPADEGPVHRPLIRATLPRPEGSATPATPRPIPEFTVRQPGTRGRFREEFRGGFRSQGGGGRNGNQQQPHGRSGRPGAGGGSGQQSRGRHGRPGPHKKRSR